MNTRNNIKVFHVVVFPGKEGVLKFLETVSKVALNAGMGFEIGYTQYAERSLKGQGIHPLELRVQFKIL